MFKLNKANKTSVSMADFEHVLTYWDQQYS